MSSKQKLGISVNLTPQGRDRLARLQELTGATQASTIEEGLLLMERVKNGENVFELYSEPLKYLIGLENEKSIKKIREAIFGGLQKIINDRLQDLQTYEIANTYMIAEIYRISTKTNAKTMEILNEFVESSRNVARDLERKRYKLPNDDE